MKYDMKILMIFLLALFVAGCGEQKPKPWKEYVSAEHNFKALFPNEPTRGPKQTNKMPGGTIDSYIYCRVEDKLKYEVVYSELPAIYKSYPVDKLLNSLIDNTLKTLGASTIKKTDISVNGFRGKEVEFDLPDGMAGRGRIVANGNRVYIAITKMPKENASSADISKFLESFEIK